MSLRIGLLGVGLIGRRHLEIAGRAVGCGIVAAADLAASARSVVEDAGARFYTNHLELLARERLDGVIIATPNSAHASVGVACAEAGLPMLVEKPLADSVESARALLVAAEAAGVNVAVGHHRRFDPSVEATKSMLDAGELGELTAMQCTWALRKDDDYYNADWRISRAGGGGPGLINLIHDIDLMRHFGGNIARVYAELGNRARALEVEDTIAATIRFTSGAVGSFVTSDATPSPWGWEQGSGENPHVPQSEHNCYRLLGTRASLALPRLEVHRPSVASANDWRRPLIRESISVRARTALEDQLANFCAVIRGEDEPRVSGRDGFASLAATLAVVASGISGQAVEPEAFELAM